MIWVLIPSLTALTIPLVSAQVTATGPNGPTNPEAPSFLPVGSLVDQSASFSRLLSLNGLDDFCLFAPPEAGPDSLIGNVEAIAVAYCTKPRNAARIIPDGAITAAHFIRTPTYVQIYGFWDGTKVNIPSGDAGGELDPHGAENLGNPMGGNVTSNVPTGSDVFYEEWMSFISYDQFCLRICTAQTNNVTTALQCEHELDIMGCQFVMAIDDFYSANNSFTSCDGDPAPPPGLYPQADGSTSTFRQRYTGTYVDGAGSTGMFTVGQTVTPSAPAYYPAKSNCVTYSSISNGVNTADYSVTAAPQLLVSGSTGAVSSGPSTSSFSSRATGSVSSSSTASASPSRFTSEPTPSTSASTTASTASSGAAAQSSTGAASMTRDLANEGFLLGSLVGGIGVLVGAILSN
ncbi:hypothetical protein BCR39DRAFT_571881 [Naematelia encephala]|uniref:Glycoprotein n=1 Tax=Naematelia encephala TaxID=71784 RepID=A0A1Y2B965_9TREE|nr:hypothetical protein BCR39DRAFT_571881 [Naematelia encephala]